ncbi:carbonic anhydrase family protein [Photobacterium halotolerans]|uniref:carbonic anhydrase family protein n=1 Tax=Photobacterium halotolerans TaxID=265726 RepID=UPI003075C567
MLPAQQDYYRFSGSLTTPPCSEGVRWLVMKAPQTLSASQITDLMKIMKHSNNRPVQPLNGRVVVAS